MHTVHYKFYTKYLLSASLLEVEILEWNTNAKEATCISIIGIVNVDIQLGYSQMSFEFRKSMSTSKM